MKRLFSAIIALVAVISLQAANSEVVRLTLTAEGSPAASNVTVRVDPSVMVAETGSYFENTELAENVNIYVVAGGSNYSSYKLNEIVNLHVAILTNRRPAANQHYTLTFNVPTINEGLKLKDLKTGDEVNIVNGATYEFDVNSTLDPGYASGTNFRIEDRFVINYAAPTPAEFEICFRDNELQITANPYAENVVVKDANDTKVVDVAPVTPYQAIDLSAQAAGRYTVELAGGARKFIIVKQ